MNIRYRTPEWLKYALTYFYIIIYILSLAGILYFNGFLLFLCCVIFIYSGVIIALQVHAILHGHFHKNRRFNEFLASFILFLNGPITYNAIRRKHLDHHKYFGTDKDPDNLRANSVFDFWYRIMMSYKEKWTIVLNIIGVLLLSFFSKKSWFVLFLIIVVSKSLTALLVASFGGYLPHQTKFNEKIIPKWFCYIISIGNMYHLEHHKYPHLYSLDLSITEEQTNSNLKYK